MNDQTIASALRWAQQRLEAATETARLDAELLLCEVLEQSRAFLFAFSERRLESEQSTRYETLVEQRATGIPIAYLLGHKEFWSLDLKVTQQTLVPRPETETLVEWVLEQAVFSAAYSPEHALQVLDLGTGTGAIALAIGSERRHWHVTATDVSAAALAVAADNARAHHIDNLTLLQSHWFEQIPKQTFHLIVSNPPYIAERDPHLQQSIRFEPAGALVSGQDGLDDIRLIIKTAPDYLVAGGLLMLEHGYDQAESVQQLLRDRGFLRIQTLTDLAQLPRITLGVMPH